MRLHKVLYFVYSSSLFLALASSYAVQAESDDLQFSDDETLSEALLSGQRGRADFDMTYQVNDSEQNALLQDNSIVNSVTGDNSISGNAFSGMSGISTVIQNSGNQVIIQGSTMVNVMINQ